MQHHSNQFFSAARGNLTTPSLTIVLVRLHFFKQRLLQGTMTLGQISRSIHVDC